ncbi:MAG TPA: hypothetical protein DEF41_05210 [Desulfovibrio sp.]|uniref:Uncharacterized protein n=1 Tax=Nitratidesulfovibrio vulgaris (strain ATCC 29579 / DSM 644 / CCUG 34227 / NCIMB 8303 / VKM B-1760 / Hildenborough) TaxID=882 RepID=Q72AM9_NITV2|nr:hypothetical protein DVU_1963 [Nitratidesulfovibrio vulgaris str. Hildenborough]HBW15531.1 hypothetical protein [Desulfovibrio sp.]
MQGFGLPLACHRASYYCPVRLLTWRRCGATFRANPRGRQPQQNGGGCLVSQGLVAVLSSFMDYGPPPAFFAAMPNRHPDAMETSCDCGRPGVS